MTNDELNDAISGLRAALKKLRDLMARATAATSIAFEVLRRQ